jgi:hypothetical protein
MSSAPMRKMNEPAAPIRASARVGEVVLIFPAGLPDAQKFRAEAQARGQNVIGASSLTFDPAAQAYETWEFLPYVHDKGFADRLADLIGRQGVTAIYAPHEVISGALSDILPRIAPGVRLIDPNPLKKTEGRYRDLLRGATEACAVDWFGLAGGRPPLTPIARAGLLRLVDTISGMTDGDKIDAVIEAMSHAPDGDLVEIGSWWGRSAALLVLLARHWNIGKVLCVDPWHEAFLDQGVEILDRASARMDNDFAHSIFQVNLAPIAGGALNFIRGPSVEAARRYGPGLVLDSETFGRTAYEGRIAVLHIDGNHTYENAKADALAWTPHVKPGGWIIFDDYVWAFGDGPKRVGDEFLTAEGERIELSFVIGTALFVKLKA